MTASRGGYAAIIFGANYANILAETRRARQEG